MATFFLFFVFGDLGQSLDYNGMTNTQCNAEVITITMYSYL